MTDEMDQPLEAHLDDAWAEQEIVTVAHAEPIEEVGNDRS